VKFLFNSKFLAFTCTAYRFLSILHVKALDAGIESIN